MPDTGIDKPRIAVIAGASGLVGSRLLDSLLSSEAYYKVIAIGRSRLPVIHPKLEQQIVDFENLDLHLPADDYFCCLGTTIRKAGSEEEFLKVDYEYPLAMAREAQKANAQFLVVTALGANQSSRIFYNQVKGRLENELAELNLPALYIFRPSLLIGKRKEFRFGEVLAKSISQAFPFLFIGPLRKYKPIPATLVARAMLLAAVKNGKGKHVYESDEILSGTQ